MKNDQKAHAKKLSIKREKLRQLTNKELESVAGGDSMTATCAGYGCPNHPTTGGGGHYKI